MYNYHKFSQLCRWRNWISPRPHLLPSLITSQVWSRKTPLPNWPIYSPRQHPRIFPFVIMSRAPPSSHSFMAARRKRKTSPSMPSVPNNTDKWKYTLGCLPCQLCLAWWPSIAFNRPPPGAMPPPWFHYFGTGVVPSLVAEIFSLDFLPFSPFGSVRNVESFPSVFYHRKRKKKTRESGGNLLLRWKLRGVNFNKTVQRRPDA